MIDKYKKKKYIIIDFGASLIHTHHSRSLYSFFDLLTTQGISPEIWIPLGSNLNSEFYPVSYKLLPGTHPCAFNLLSIRTWIPGILGKIHNIALKFNLNFLLKFIVNFSTRHFIFKIKKLNRDHDLSLVFTTMCPFAVKSIYDLEKRRINAEIFCRITDTSEVRGMLSKIYSMHSLILDSKTFVFLKLKFGAETKYSYRVTKQLNNNSYLSKFPYISPKVLDNKNNSIITVSFLGHPTRDKGQDKIIPIIHEVSSKRKDIKWQVHIYDNDPLEINLKKIVPDIYLIRGKVQNVTIEEALINTQVLCLPYNVSAFKFKASAMHYQSSDYEKPVITFSGTEFADDIKEFKAGAIVKDVSELCEVILNLNSSLISDWKKGCREYNSSRNRSNLEFLGLE